MAGINLAGAYTRWAAGYCPCCGADEIEESVSGVQPEAIGEGVMMCGRCIENEHHSAEFVPLMLAAIAEGAASHRVSTPT